MSSPACAEGCDTPAQQREDSTTFMTHLSWQHSAGVTATSGVDVGSEDPDATARGCGWRDSPLPGPHYQALKPSGPGPATLLGTLQICSTELQGPHYHPVGRGSGRGSGLPADGLRAPWPPAPAPERPLAGSGFNSEETWTNAAVNQKDAVFTRLLRSLRTLSPWSLCDLPLPLPYCFQAESPRHPMLFKTCFEQYGSFKAI